MGVHAFIHGADQVVTDAGGTFIIDEVIPGLEFQLWRRYASKRSGYGKGLVNKRKGRVRPDHRPWKAQAR